VQPHTFFNIPPENNIFRDGAPYYSSEFLTFCLLSISFRRSLLFKHQQTLGRTNDSTAILITKEAIPSVAPYNLKYNNKNVL